MVPDGTKSPLSMPYGMSHHVLKTLYGRVFIEYVIADRCIKHA